MAAIAAYLGEVGPRRRVRLVPAVGATAVALVLGFGSVARLVGWDAGAATLLAYEIVLAAIAAGLLADLLRGRWSQAAVTGLVVDLGGLWEPVTLRDRLARALGDSSLQLGYWLADEQRYIDERGRSLALPGADPDRVITPVDRHGEHVAVLVHDPSVLDDPVLAEAVAAATRIAVANVRLRAEVGARVEQLAASHRRIVEAADAQRRRLQRELRQGAERRLVAVSAHVDTLSVQVGESRAPELFGDVQEQLRAARVELSELARGIHPPALATGGLAAALPELARRAPIPVDVHADGRRGPEAVEAAAYFVCAEALANVAEYAQASRASVHVAHHDARLEVAVSDDGVGGADPNLGSGLRGLADRVEALGGRLSVESPRGAGTRLVAEIPTRDAALSGSVVDAAPGLDEPASRRDLAVDRLERESVAIQTPAVGEDVAGLLGRPVGSLPAVVDDPYGEGVALDAVDSLRPAAGALACLRVTQLPAAEDEPPLPVVLRECLLR